MEERLRNREGREPLERECEAARMLIGNWFRQAQARLGIKVHSRDE